MTLLFEFFFGKNGKDKSYKKAKDKDEEVSIRQNPNNDDESELADLVQKNFNDSRVVRGAEHDVLGLSIEEIWEDEKYIYKGGGLQWATNIAPRSKRERQLRPNSEDNFVFNTLAILNANITMTSPDPTIEGVGDDDNAIAEKLTFASRFNDERNCFESTWSKLVFDFISSGPTILMVHWDNGWEGGKGPNRWIGDVRLTRVIKGEFFPDPAIDDWEERLQDCEYIIRRLRKKLCWLKSRWPDRGNQLYQETLDEYNSDKYEGSDPQSAYLYEYRHKGYPKYMPKERKQELKKRAEALDLKGDYWKARNYYDAAKGDLEGVHVAYVCNGIVLEYIPYEYENGKYPFVYTTEYYDEDSPWGFGEIRNTKIPQILHNKADEIEIEACVKQGLGGKEYQVGAISPTQLRNILANNGKGGMYFEVDNINLIKDRTGPVVPANIINYKEHKQRMIETISQVTPSVQGRAEYANMPYKALAELGARSDTRTKNAAKKLGRFLKEANKQRIELFEQFYTEQRYYRIKGSNGKTISGTIVNDDMYAEWDRVVKDENGEIQLDELGNPIVKKERFVPELDVRVQILSEKPTDRNYYTSVGFEMFARGLMTGEDLWYTIEEGKFPPKDDILKNVTSQNLAMQITGSLQKLPPQMQEGATNIVKQSLDQVLANAQQYEMAQKQMQKIAQKGVPVNLGSNQTY